MTPAGLDAERGARVPSMTTVSPAFTFSGVGTSLGKKSVAASTSFSATLDSIAGVNSVAWSIAGTDETTSADDYTLTPSGTKGETVTLTSGAIGTAGILSCTVNSGVDPQTGSPSTTMTKTAKWYVPLADGGEVGAGNETTESDPTFGSTGIINGIARRASATLAAVTTTDDTPVILIEVPFGANASASGTISILATSADAPGAYTYFSAGGLIYTSGGILAFAGSPLESTCTTFSPDSPAWAPNYDVPREKLQIIGTGVAGATVQWKIKFDAFTVIG